MAEKRVRVWVQQFKDRTDLVLQWHDPVTGRRKSETAGTADTKEAEDRRADKESDLNHGRHADASAMTWARFRELFEEQYVAALRPNTRSNYAAVFDAFERVCNPRRLRAINERTLSAFAAGLRTTAGRAKGSTGHAASTIRQRLSLLKKALRWAVKERYLPSVPAFPGVKVPKKKPQPVPVESFERLLAKASDPNLRTFLLAGWLAGLRLAEAVALEWAPTHRAPHLDAGHNRIVIPAEFAKADEDQWVPLDPALLQALEQLPRAGRKVFRFVNRQGKPVGLNAVGGRVIRLAKRAGVKLTMHSLRKGFGCRYAGKVPAQVLQRLMRHSNIKVTMDYYANVDEAAMAAVLGSARNDSRNIEGGLQAPAEKE
jgi:integrase